MKLIDTNSHLHIRARELAYQVDALAGICPPDGYFVDGDVTQYEDYCGDCIDAVFEQAKRARPEADLFIGSTSGSENDSGLYCAGCGRLLAYSLTDYGSSEELQHFRTYCLGEWNDGLEPETIYAIARAALNGAYCADLAETAIEVCTWALQLQGFSRQLARLADDGGPA